MKQIRRTFGWLHALPALLSLMLMGLPVTLQAQQPWDNGGGDWMNITQDQAIQRGFLQVVGYSEGGQSRYQAVRAATVVAQRDLLEAFKGIRIHGDTTVEKGFTLNDTIRTRVAGYLRGAQPCGVRYDQSSGHAEACMRLNLRGRHGAYEVVLPALQESGLIPPPMASNAPAANFIPRPQSYPTGTTPPMNHLGQQNIPAHDGLIIEMGGQPFKPAMVNRILQPDGQVLFDPSRIVNAILVERGCGGFTNDIGKAVGLLSNWGVRNPLRLKAQKTQQGTDVVVFGKDAALITATDAMSHYLAQAKVVFVIN